MRVNSIESQMLTFSILKKQHKLRNEYKNKKDIINKLTLSSNY